MGKIQWMLLVVGLAILLLGVLSYLQGSIAEGFYVTESNKPDLQSDITKMIKSVTRIGKKMLDPELWNYRIHIMNLSPVELARKQIALEKKV
jgi:hypothetical protein